jgi:hypothetical protein
MTVLLDSIKNKVVRENNIGGLFYVLFLPIEFIVSLPAMLPEGYIDVSEIPINTVEKWWQFKFIDQSGKLSWKQKLTADGMIYEIEIEGQVAKDYVARYSQFKRFEHKEFFIVCVDNNRYARLIGEMNLFGEKRGARVNFDFLTGNKPETLNVANVGFRMISTNPPTPAYYEALPIDIGSPDPNPFPGVGDTGGGGTD